LLPSYTDHDVLVRGTDPLGLVKSVLEASGGRIKAVQLFSPGREIEALNALPPAIAIDLYLTDLRQSEGIPKWNDLMKGRAIRLVVPVIHGFSRVVKEALRATLRVALEIGQPNGTVVDEIEDTFMYFVRQPEVTQPVDLFSRLLTSFLTGRADSLWRIQEEHPSWNRYVTDAGEVFLSSRLASVVPGSNANDFLAEHKLNLFLRKDECCTCRFFSHCEGYFKLPVRSYDCSAIKVFLALVRDCAAELRTDLSQFSDPAPTDV